MVGGFSEAIGIWAAGLVYQVSPARTGDEDYTIVDNARKPEKGEERNERLFVLEVRRRRHEVEVLASQYRYSYRILKEMDVTNLL